jgi:hypothetical protein
MHRPWNFDYPQQGGITHDQGDEVMQSEQTNDLSAALAKAQAAMKAAPFDKANPHFKNKYASLASVIDTIRKPLADNGLSYTQTTEVREGGFVLVTTLRHASGQWVASEYPLPIAAKPQELGSALTYARRYSLSAIACIAADEDDDAEGARTSNQASSTPAAKPNPVQPQSVEPPTHPETGEVSPHEITAPNATAYGSLFIAAVNVAQDAAELFQWQEANKNKLTRLQESAPKIHERVMAAITTKMVALEKVAA